MNSVWRVPGAGSGTIVAIGGVVTLIALLFLGLWVGWDQTWRSVGVTPLHPHFFDMHIITDYAACAAKGFDAYVPASCNPGNFNIPPVWLWVGYVGIDGSDSNWLSIAMAAAAFAVMLALFKGRSVGDGIVALVAILSPSVLMGVERGNLDLLILALVGTAALIYQQQSVKRIFSAIAVVGLAILLKLFPMFCVALVARFNRRTVLFTAAVAAISLAYLAAISGYLPLIHRNVPMILVLSYGYKTPFLYLDHLLTEEGLKPLAMVDTWVPIALAVLTLIIAAAAALVGFNHGRLLPSVSHSVPGTAFLFGSGIYCGTFLLGANFIYRLTFLLLCLPQFQDWCKTKSADTERTATSERLLFGAVLAALWLNGNSNGHKTFWFVPHLLDWLLFFGLATVIASNFLNSAFNRKVPAAKSGI